MGKKNIFSIQLTGFLLFAFCINIAAYPNKSVLKFEDIPINPSIKIYQNDYNSKTDIVTRLNTTLQTFLQKGDYTKSKLVIDRLIPIISMDNLDTTSLSDSYYFIGIYYSISRNLNKAIYYLKLSVVLREDSNVEDDRYARALYNLGLAYYSLGDFRKLEECNLRSIEILQKIYGKLNPASFLSYSGLIIAYIELQNYEKAIYFSNLALQIVNANEDLVPQQDIANLYYNLGVCYISQVDFSKARIYLEKSESIYNGNFLNHIDAYINLLNSMAVTYGNLGLSEKSNEYYEKGIKLALTKNSPLAYNLINSYSIILGNKGEIEKGESLQLEALKRANLIAGEESQTYFDVLKNYGEFLREYKHDYKKSIDCFLKCMVYLSKNSQDMHLKTTVYTGYSLSLTESGEPEKALNVIQSLLFPEKEQSEYYKIFDNPGIDKIKIDKQTLSVFRTKYSILWDLYSKTHDEEILIAASKTSEVIVSLLEKVRINISQEDSRLILGDKYRNSYINAIHDFNLLFSQTKDRFYLEKAFEYSEKSKAAGLLTSSRELKAAQFHVPAEIAEFEQTLQREINLLNARITEESLLENPDTSLIPNWKEILLIKVRKRDSLILVFENQYPDYYTNKYNTQVVKLNDISKIIGRNGNYINYVTSDTLLYIFIANRKQQQLLTVKVDSSFYSEINQFRRLLSMPSPTDNARLSFEKFQISGYELYKNLIVPLIPFLISDKLIISPDNILSYLPFETIPTSSSSAKNILYRDIHYLMNDFDISYTYSATFMEESGRETHGLGNKAIAFAPDYSEPIDIQQVLMSRQAANGVLPDLPYARQEAEYVSKITHGKLFENEAAKESVFKSESGRYDIIHLAMHTIINDVDPMRSTLIFSRGSDSLDDGYLKTYEVYSIPLKAKMVVLSSCNTGSGHLDSGEGIMSLARGFIFSGSQSVVMSMWEIEDRSGTEIVKMFYKNLKSGNSKSKALRRARIAYLKDVDQLRSHPYFWSALVVYGNNSPLYFPYYLIITSIMIIIGCTVLFVFHFKKRIYS
jgi:CHAT domain-containing protein